MLERLTQGLNVAIFGSLAWMAVSAGLGEPGRAPRPAAEAGVVTRPVTTRPINPVRTISEGSAPGSSLPRPGTAAPSPVRTVTEVPQPAAPGGASPAPQSQPAPAAANPPAGAVQPAAAPQPSGPRLFSPSAPLLPRSAIPEATRQAASGDAYVPPLVRKRPPREAGPAAPPAKASKAERKATVTAAARKPDIDLSGRSALGAPPAPKCATGQRYDTKAAKCMKAPAAKANAARARLPSEGAGAR